MATDEKKIKDQFPEGFPKYQVTYQKGGLNFTVRSSEGEIATLEAIESLLREAIRKDEDEKNVYPVIAKVVADQKEKTRVTSSAGFLHSCKIHNLEMEYRDWVSKKTGKRHKGWFCPAPDCKEVEWVSDNNNGK